MTLKAGIVMLFCELVFLAVVSVASPADAIGLVTMIAACHLGGRLAFIGIGLENGYHSHLVIPMAIYHRTTWHQARNRLSLQVHSSHDNSTFGDDKQWSMQWYGE